MNARSSEDLNMAADQGLAYENAVLQARKDPELKTEIESAFLQEDADEAVRRFQASEHLARILRLLKDHGVGPGAQVMDLGGGRGVISASLVLAGFEVTLCEPNPSAVCGAGAARELSDSQGIRLGVVNGFVSDVEAPDGGFDAVVCRAVLHHIEPHIAATLRSVWERLRPGGIFVASDEPTIREPSELIQLRREHPFVQFGVDEWAGPAEHYVAEIEAAGFEDVKSLFPVSFGDYRRFIRPALPVPAAAAAYTRYRLRSLLRPEVGQVRSFVGRKPS